MVNYIKAEISKRVGGAKTDRVTQINRSILALQRMAELHRVNTQGSLTPNPSLTEKFFEGVRVV